MKCWDSYTFEQVCKGYTVNVVKKEPINIKQLYILISCWDWSGSSEKNDMKQFSLATSERLEGHWWQEGGVWEDWGTVKEGDLVHLRRPLEKAPYKTHSEENKEGEGV